MAHMEGWLLPGIPAFGFQDPKRFGLDGLLRQSVGRTYISDGQPRPVTDSSLTLSSGMVFLHLGIRICDLT